MINSRLIQGRWGRPVIYALFGVAVFLLFGDRVFSAFDNGFDLSKTLIPSDEIHHGGPPRDGIPAIDDPIFVAAGQAGYLNDEDRVLGISIGGLAKAYPIRVLDWHEIVNDEFDGNPTVVSYCPLCGTGMAFDARIDGQSRSFGVSGLLYNSDVLLYDRESESLWSQVLRKSVSGPLIGQDLRQVPLSHTTWRDWRARHPKTLVLSTETGHSRDYSRSPYGGYADSTSIFFPVKNKSDRFHPKELVIGVNLDGNVKAYPFSELSRSRATISDKMGGTDLRIEFDAANRTGRVLDVAGDEIPSTISFWFAWYAFFPNTAVFVFN